MPSGSGETREPPVIRVRLVEIRPIPPFDFVWPSGNREHFDRGWEGKVVVDGVQAAVRHGVGKRPAYGRDRVHSVTFVNGWPAVEGVESDDYPRTRALLSLLKRPDKKHARTDEDIPAGYEAFIIVNVREEIPAPYSPDSLAVKIAEDDVAAWSVHAAIRAASYGAIRQKRDLSIALLTKSPLRLVPVSADRQAIARAILEFGSRVKAHRVDSPPEFTPDVEANQLVLRDPFAFLLAVIFDEGIPAERAWRAPYELQRRLGHLDPKRILESPGKVREAVQRPPKLHRWVEKLPIWIVSAARQVVMEYHGHAGTIWTGSPTAKQLQARLDAFAGIGQKKAAMAVEILARDLGVPISGLEGSDVAYDVHVRRVFLRTTLADHDELDHIIAVARQLHPERPGALDAPAWLIGRQWCHAGTPNCAECVLARICPKEVYRAESVRGA